MLPVLLLGLGLSACFGPRPPRPYFDRAAGGYVDLYANAPSASVAPATSSSADGKPDAKRKGTRAVAGAPGRLAAPSLRSAAEAYLGVPYRFGGESRAGMDCSGFIRTVIRQTHGLVLPHNSGKMFGYGEAVKRRELRPGDLVFFKSRLGGINHAGIYMGEGRFIHASSSRGVRYSALSEKYFASRYAGARRLPPAR